MAKYVTLGPQANCFADYISGFSIRKGQTLELGPIASVSSRIKRAIATGHLVVVTKSEKPPEVDEGKFSDMTKAQLLEFYQAEYEVNRDQIDEFSKKSRKVMVEELLALG